MYALALAVVVLVPSFVAVLVTLLFAGLAWTSVISTLNAELQLFLPAWVRARGLAVYLVTFTGCLAFASALWGQVTEVVGIETTFLIAAAVVGAGVVAGAFLSVPDTGHLDQAPVAYWGEPQLAFEPEPDSGPIMVTVSYTVAPERQADYLVAMQELRRSRLRSGATPLGAVPRRRAGRALRGELPGALVGGTPAPARGTPDRDRSGDRAGGAGVLRPAGDGRAPAPAGVPVSIFRGLSIKVYGHIMASAVEIYLQNHEAAARAGHDLFRRSAANQRPRPYADELAALADDVRDDLAELRSLMREAGFRANPVLGVALRLGERLGRLKPNGRILTRSPLSDLIEVEALLDAVNAKRAGWIALTAAAPLDRVDSAQIETLKVRADDQIARLEAIHSSVAERVLKA